MFYKIRGGAVWMPHSILEKGKEFNIVFRKDNSFSIGDHGRIEGFKFVYRLMQCIHMIINQYIFPHSLN